ncbi:Hpt domain-containing protein [Methylosinus sp. H3A]|uniref:Hpt domain-containing protein n=1 Tax=Methylosinus sp. H3A TaxID=2785786 RepID=UPI0018C2D121|nr:Hpt domain-containing protein [Methylosinus sp. H3A]MBG0809466.1 Hpt domain-containing protein [Methylosinus sp. H3A]
MTDGDDPDTAKAAPKAGQPALDWAYLARQTMGDAELEAELLALFSVQAGEFGGRLAAAGTDKARHDLAHTLKGAARAIGAFALGDAAEEYESALAAAEGAPDRLRALDARLDEAQQAISARLSRG